MSDQTNAIAVDAEPDREVLPMNNIPLFRPSQITHLERPIPWLWDGYISRAQITLLTGQWKIGKTSLVAALLGRLGVGGELAGRPVRSGKAVVLTEESASLWIPRNARHGIGDWVAFGFEPFRTKPLPEQWGFLLDDLTALRRRRKVDLIVLDSLAYVLPGREEQNAAAMNDALRPLRELAATGPGILILHHPSKGTRVGGHAARGTGALPAFVDVLIEMHWAGPASEDNRRRVLAAWSRYEATPRRNLIERTADGLDWRQVDDDMEDLIDDTDRIAEEVVQTHENATAQDILAHWPEGIPRPGLRSLSGRLQMLTILGRLERSGAGHRYEPYRYGVVEKEASIESHTPTFVEETPRACNDAQ